MNKIIVLLAILMSIQVVGQEQINKYYKHLVFRETPYSAVKGRIPIEKERAAKENHYKFSYNSEGKLLLIQYLFGDIQISRARAGSMDGFRNIHSKTKIEYLDNQEIRTFYNTEGVQCSNMMKVYKEIYTYNAKGKKIGAQFYDKEGKLTNNTWKIAEYIWEPANEFDVIEKRKNNKGDYVPMRPYYHFMTTLYKYTPDGILKSMNHIDANLKLVNDFNDDKGIAIDKATYDENLNLTGFKFYNADNIATVGSFLDCAGGDIKYDKNGNCIQYSTIDLDGNLMLSRDKAYDLYKFDAYGNTIERGHYGLNNEIIEFRGYTKTEFIYDSIHPAKKGKVKRYQLK